MAKLSIDHIVISVKDLKKSAAFYEKFLGKGMATKQDVSWTLGHTKLFLTSSYVKKPKAFNKHDLGLNHIAFRVSSLTELKGCEAKLAKAKIKNSGIQKDKYSKKEFIWFDDLDGIRLEFYLRN